MLTGFLLIDKPAGITSHDVIDRLRKTTGERTIGHAGTLDPFATGLLLVAVGRESTKHLQEFVGLPKTYEAEILLGVDSTTHDPEGEKTDKSMKNGQPITLTVEAIEAAMQKLTGDLRQIPPMHAAIKIKGKKLYELAREGKTVERAPRPVTVSRFDLVEAKLRLKTIRLPGTVEAIIDCSSGTYIRALARDLGEALGTAAYVSALRRTKIGEFSLEQAAKLEELNKTNWFDRLIAPMLRSEHKS